MKRCSFLLMAFFAIGSLQAQVQPQAAQPQAQAAPAPKDINKYLSFTNDAYDFGKIPAGKPTEFQVSVKNVSRDSITLKNVQVSCGCTTPKFDKDKRFGPGETVNVTLGFSGNANGAFSKTVTFYFSEDLTKVVTFKGDAFQVPATSAPANEQTQKLKSN